MQDTRRGIWRVRISIMTKRSKCRGTSSFISLTKDNNMAEEIVQKTFYKGLKNISKYNPEMKMLTWLCAIAKNTYFTEIKKQSRHEVLEDDVISLEIYYHYM